VINLSVLLEARPSLSLVLIGPNVLLEANLMLITILVNRSVRTEVVPLYSEIAMMLNRSVQAETARRPLGIKLTQNVRVRATPPLLLRTIATTISPSVQFGASPLSLLVLGLARLVRGKLQPRVEATINLLILRRLVNGAVQKDAKDK